MIFEDYLQPGHVSVSPSLHSPYKHTGRTEETVNRLGSRLYWFCYLAWLSMTIAELSQQFLLLQVKAS